MINIILLVKKMIPRTSFLNKQDTIYVVVNIAHIDMYQTGYEVLLLETVV